MGTKILIIDPVQAQIRALENILKETGHEMIFASRTVEKAARILEKETDIGLIISEWDLEDKSGLDFFNSMKTNEKLGEIPVILAFRDKTKEEIIKAKKCGVAGFFVKPYKGDVVQEKVSKIFKNAGPGDKY